MWHLDFSDPSYSLQLLPVSETRNLLGIFWFMSADADILATTNSLHIFYNSPYKNLINSRYVDTDTFSALVNVCALGHRVKTEMRNSFHCQWPEDNIASWNGKHNKAKIFSYKKKNINVKNDGYYSITWTNALITS